MTCMVSPYHRWGLMNLEVLMTSAQRNWRTVWPSPWSSKGWKAGLMPDQQSHKTNAVCGKGPVQIRMEIRMMRISYIEILLGYPHSVLLVYNLLRDIISSNELYSVPTLIVILKGSFLTVRDFQCPYQLIWVQQAGPAGTCKFCPISFQRRQSADRAGCRWSSIGARHSWMPLGWVWNLSCSSQILYYLTMAREHSHKWHRQQLGGMILSSSHVAFKKSPKLVMDAWRHLPQWMSTLEYSFHLWSWALCQ